MPVPTQADYDQLATDLARLTETVDSWTEATPEAPMRFGTTAPRGIDALEASIGVRFGARRSYNAGLPAAFASHDAAKDVGKRASVASVKWGAWSDLTGLTAALTAFARSWPSGHPGALILNHEPEDDGKPAADFRAMQDRAGAVAHDNLPDGVAFGGCLMAFTSRPTSGRQVADWLPSDHAAWDFLAWDGYSDDGTWTPERLFGVPAQLSGDYGWDFAIAEYGTANPSVREAWTRDVADFADLHAAPFACYYCSAITGAAYPWAPADYDGVRATALAYGGSELPVAIVAEAPELDDDDRPGPDER